MTVGIITLVVLTVPLAFTAALTTSIAAAAVLLGVAVADARHFAGRAPEVPSPPA
ncbi:hypothetical protein [Micromonospora purpureochromogenes]|uniref:hypothetical protein n=1 Tax=Micromonospora purpureochromogenes TaxID=47872 RepID=UPI0012FDE0B4|nr:hypothetical protein [Micromonospora purpureochromogenes]